MARRMLAYYDETMLEHNNGYGHPERPDRVRAILRALDRRSIDGLEMHAPRRATVAEARRVHSVAHVDRIEGLAGRTTRIDGDTGVSPKTSDAAFLSAGASVNVVEALSDGSCDRAVALCRPPGHHAEHERAMGFCFLNNIAIAAAHARAELGYERVLIIDWDVHHCNGTQEAFYDRDDVLVFSSHRFPFYPGTGALEEIGEGAGEGFNINVPLEAGAGDQRIIALYEDLLPPVCATFKPDLILISAGFDAHAHDPLGGLRMSTAGFAYLCSLMVTLAEEHADGKLGFILEGGYDLDALSSSMHACLSVASGAVRPAMERTIAPGSDPLMAHLRATFGRYWPRLSVDNA